jgi:hypothetical protein
MNDDARYALTPMQRLLHRGLPQGIFTGVLGLFFADLAQSNGILPQGRLVFVLGGAVGFLTGRGIALAILRTSGGLAEKIYSPSGDSTAYTPTFSNIEALEIKGDLEGAAVAWSQAVAEQPEHALTVVRAADFHLRARKDPTAALALYQQARALGTGTDDLRRYVQQKLVDLYLGPLADDGRALVELRRLIDAFPGTREAEAARVALAEIKARRAGPAS